VSAPRTEDFDPTTDKEECDTLDFKSAFDPGRLADWCELVKDIVAMANSGGGTIVIGANDDGTASGYDATIFQKIDPADIVNKLHKYTEQQFADFRVGDCKISGQSVALLVIGGVRFPIVFTAPGGYEISSGKPKSAFRVGTVYFRHGAKSEPGTTQDLRNALDRELTRLRAFWLDGITKVVEAPDGSEVQVVKSTVALDGSAGAKPIRLTHAGDAPEFKVIDNDKIYPYRSKELLKKLTESLGSNVLSSHDVLLVRRVHVIDTNPTFSHKGIFGTRQYSNAFVDWLLAEYANDKQFFQKLREIARAQKKNAAARQEVSAHVA
jgi:hypothetical protein